MVEEGERETETKQETVIITVKELKRAIARMLPCKIFWFNKATSLHPKLKQHLQECVNAGEVPTWMAEGRAVLLMKDKSKGTVYENTDQLLAFH